MKQNVWRKPEIKDKICYINTQRNQLVVDVTSLMALTNDCLSCQEYHIALIENYKYIICYNWRDIIIFLYISFKSDVGSQNMPTTI